LNSQDRQCEVRIAKCEAPRTPHMEVNPCVVS